MVAIQWEYMKRGVAIGCIVFCIFLFVRHSGVYEAMQENAKRYREDVARREKQAAIEKAVDMRIKEETARRYKKYYEEELKRFEE